MATPKPEQMREAVARYVAGIHRAYTAQAATFPPGVRGRLPLLAGGPLTVAAVAARNLHVLATRESLGPVREPEVELSEQEAGLRWTLRRVRGRSELVDEMARAAGAPGAAGTAGAAR